MGWLLPLLLLLGPGRAWGQTVKNLPGDYASFTAAITDINTNFAAGGVTVNVAAGYAESPTTVIPALTAQGTGGATGQIIFQKSGSGANPKITASWTASSTTLDAIITLSGADYVTFNGIDLADATTHTTQATAMEAGYGLFRPTATNGSLNNTIQNCVVTLNRSNIATNANGNVWGIYLANSTAASTTAITTTSAAGTNSNNKFYGNTLLNTQIGVNMLGYADSTSPYTYYDQGNDVGGTSTATGNTIQNFGGYAGAASGIRLSYQNGVNASYNTIANAANGGAASPNTLYGIYQNNGTNAGGTYSSNTITLVQAGNASQVSHITLAQSGTGAVTVSNNTLSLTNSAAASGTYYCLYFSGAFASETVSGNTLSGTSGTPMAINTTSSVYFIYTSNSTATETFTNNTSNYVSKTGAGGSYYGFYNFGSPTGGTATLTGNTISNITLTGATGFEGIDHRTATAQHAVINGNTISNITGGSSTAYGLYVGYGDATSTFNANLVTGLTGTGTVYGLFLTATSTAAVAQNTITAVSSSGASSSVYALFANSGTTNNISSSKIYNISSSGATGAAYGLYVSGGTTTNLANNLIGGVSAGASSTTVAAAGLYIASITSGTINAYYNTIYLNASNTGTGGSAGIYATGSTTATTSALTLIDNIVVNATSTGTGVSAAYRRSSASLTNYGSSSNNNLFYTIASPTAARPIYYDGTTASPDLASYKAVATPRDAASVTELPPFQSTTASATVPPATDTYLHIATGTATQVESGGKTVSGYPTDYDGDTRSTTTPDIGADEGSFTPTPNQVVASTAYTQRTANVGLGSAGQQVAGIVVTTSGTINPLSLSAVTFNIGSTSTADISNAKLYSSPSSTFSLATATLLPTTGSIASPSYTLTLSTAATLSTSSTSNYFFLTYDIPSGATPNDQVTTSATSLTISGSGYTPTLSGAAGALTIQDRLAGTYTVGAGGTYTTITAAIADLTLRGTKAPVVFSLINASSTPYSIANGETFPLSITAFTRSGAASDLVTFKPAAGVSPQITNAATATNSDMWKLTDVSYVTIDGSNTSNGTTRDLTLTNTGASTRALVWIATSGGTASNHNAVLNTVQVGTNNTSATIVSAGVMISGTSYNAAAPDNDYHTVTNNAITGTYLGIVAGGTAAVSANGLDGLTITNNVVGPATAATASNIGLYGIFTQGAVSPVVTGNTVQNVVSTSGGVYGIAVPASSSSYAVAGATISGNTVKGISGAGASYGLYTISSAATISTNVLNGVTSSTSDVYGIVLAAGATGATLNRNQVLNVTSTSTGGYSGHGIDINTVGTTASATLTNNFVGGIGGSGWTNLSNATNAGITGIRLLGTQATFKLYHNSVNLTGTAGYSGTSTILLSAALYVDTNSSDVTVEDNVLVNTITSPSASTSSKAYALYSAAAKTAYATGGLNYNDYYVGTGSQGYIGAMNGTSAQTLAAFVAASGQDANSVSGDPQFTSATDLHINSGATANVVESAGVLIAAAGSDIDNQARGPYPLSGQANGGGTAPDLGADEGDFAPVLNSKVTAITYTQNNTATVPGATTQQVAGLDVVVGAGTGSLSLNSISFQLGASTQPGDITNAVLYSTGTSGTFATTTPVATTGTIASAAGGTYTLTLTTPATLVNSKDNYFFLTYDIQSGATPGDVVQSVPTAVAVSGNVSATYTSATTPAITASGTITGRPIQDRLAGTYTVGAGGTYTTITAAIADLTLRGTKAPVVFSLINASSTPYNAANGETFPLNVTAFTRVGAASDLVTFKPASGVQPTVVNAGTTSLFKLTDVSYVTIDGSNTSGGTTRDLTLSNTGTSNAQALVWIATSGGTASNHNAVLNTVLTGASNTTSNSAGVNVSGTTYNTATTGNNSHTVSNNAITGVYNGISYAGTSAGPLTGVAITGNVVGPATAATATTVNRYGIYVAGASAPVITGNTVQNVASTLAAYGIELLTVSNGATVTGNTVAGISSSGSSARGLTLDANVAGTSAAPVVVDKNKFTTITSTSTSGFGGIGIYVAPAVANAYVRLSNNFVADLHGTGYSSLTGGAVVGILLNGATAQSGISLYHNSVSLTGTYAATGNTSGGLLTAALGVTAGNTGLDIRDNIFQNSLVGSSSYSSTSYAFYSLAAASAYTTLDYNDYYVSGTQGVLAYFGSANVTTLAALQAATTQDAHSVSGDPQFTSATDLHINSGTSGNAVESAGVLIAAAGNDIDNQARGPYPLSGQTNGGGTAPDLGADEGDFKPLPPAVVSAITYTQNNTATVPGATTQQVAGLDVKTSTGSGTLSLSSISFQLGASTQPGDITNAKLYSTGTSGTFAATTLVATTGTIASAAGGTYTLTLTTPAVLALGSDNYFFLTYDIQSGATLGDVVQSVPTAVVVSGSTYTSSTTPALTASGTITGRPIRDRLAGLYTVGQPTAAVPAPSYATLTAAIADLSMLGTKAPVTFSLINAGTTPYSTANGETFPLTVNPFVRAGAATDAVTFKPAAGVQPVVTGAVASGAVFRLNGVSYITLDGSNTTSGTTRDLTLTNTGTVGTGGNAVVWLSNNATTTSIGSSNNTVKNLVLTGASAGSVSVGVVVAGTTTVTSSTVTANSTNTIANNLVYFTRFGVTVFGTSTSTLDANNVVSNNTLGLSSTQGLTVEGIYSAYQTGLTVSGNNVQFISNSASTDLYGIDLQETQYSVVSANSVHDISTSSANGYAVYGISVLSYVFDSSTNPSSATVVNNLVYRLTAPSNSTAGYPAVTGLFTADGYADKFYFNTVNLTGTLSAGGVASAFSNCDAYFDANSYTPSLAINVRNNLLVVNGTATGGASFFAHYTTEDDYSASTLNANDLYAKVSSGTGATAYIGADYYGTYSTLSSWKTETGEKAKSVSVDPVFDATQIPSGAGATALNNIAIAISTVTTDIIGATRAATPDPGAYEFPTQLNVALAAGALASPLSNYCTPQPNAIPISVTVTNTQANAVVLSQNQQLVVTGTVKLPDATTQAISATITSGTIAANGTLTVPAGSITLSQTGTYTFQSLTVKLQIADGTQLVETSTTDNTLAPNPTVTVNPLPTATFSASNKSVVCFGTSTTLTGTLTGTAPFTGTYTVNGGAAQPLTTSGNTFSIVTGNLTAGTTIAIASLSDANSCAATTANLPSTTLTTTTTTTWNGSVSSDWYTSANWDNCVPTADISAIVPATLATSASAPVIASGSAAVNNLTLQGSPSLTLSGASTTLAIGGTLSTAAAGTFVAGTGTTTTFATTGFQAIGMATFYNLTLGGNTNKSLGGSIFVNGTLDLTNGQLSQLNYDMTLNAATSAVTGASLAHHVTLNGNGGRICYVGLGGGNSAYYPVGVADNSFSPVTLTNAGTADSYCLTIQTGVDNPVTSGAHYVNRQWNIEEGTPGGSNVTMQVQWMTSSENPGFDRTNCGIAHYITGTGWVLPATDLGAATAGPEANSWIRTRSGLTSFSPFAVEDNTYPLPVELTTFTAQRQGQDARLDWTTATERQNQGFEVQVSLDGQTFRQLGFVAGAGTSLAPRTYHFLDREAGKLGRRYYRLRQVDFDGSAHFTQVQAVDFEAAAEASLSAVPNPFGSELRVLVSAAQPVTGQELTLTDMLGRVVRRQPLSLPAGQSELSLTETVQGLPTGVYLLQLPLDGQLRTVKVVKE